MIEFSCLFRFINKTTFIFLWGTFYRKMSFGLKNSRETFQGAMSYVFHDTKNIVDSYLHDLTTHSKK